MKDKEFKVFECKNCGVIVYRTKRPIKCNCGEEGCFFDNTQVNQIIKTWYISKEKISKIIDKTKIIKKEICQCGHPKEVHLPHQLDKNGGRCMICVNCPIYTWKEFEFVDLKELKQKMEE